MKVGDYVRFYDRDWTEIGQIVDEVEDSHLKVVKCRDGYYDLDNFIKSSPNIIDLIEVGDYVNGYLVTTGNQGVGSIYIAEIDGLGLKKKLYEKDIKSIVTREQFSQMEYRIGE